MRRGACRYLKVPPALVVRRDVGEAGDDAGKLGSSHVGQVVVVDEGATARVVAPDDVAAGGLGVMLPVDAVAQVDRGVGAKRVQHGAGRGRVAGGQAGDEIEAQAVAMAHVDQLLQHLERVWAVAAAADGAARGAELRVFLGVVRDAAAPSAQRALRVGDAATGLRMVSR